MSNNKKFGQPPQTEVFPHNHPQLLKLVEEHVREQAEIQKQAEIRKQAEIQKQIQTELFNLWTISEGCKSFEQIEKPEASVQILYLMLGGVDSKESAENVRVIEQYMGNINKRYAEISRADGSANPVEQRVYELTTLRGKIFVEDDFILAKSYYDRAMQIGVGAELRGEVKEPKPAATIPRSNSSTPQLCA